MDDHTKRATATKTKHREVNFDEGERFEINIKKKKINIEKKYLKSVPNNIYIFPRLPSLDDYSESSDSETEIGFSYNLKSQNLKSRKNQTKVILNHLRENKLKEYNSVRSEKSILSLEEGGKTLKNRKSKSKNIEISYETKKKTPSRAKNNSQRKLFAEQYSLDNRTCAVGTKDYNGLIVSFRGHQKHEINISLSGRRMKTEIN